MVASSAVREQKGAIAVGVAGSTYSVIVQNFGWAMGYNVSALPLAAFGLLDPLVAAVAMGLSSVIVVLNSLRLTRVGRSGLARVQPPRVLRGRRGVVASVALPVVLFAGLTLVSQLVSPARGQSLLPDLPSISTRALPQGGSVETYVEPGRAGVNQFHRLINAKLTTAIPSEAISANLNPLRIRFLFIFLSSSRRRWPANAGANEVLHSACARGAY